MDRTWPSVRSWFRRWPKAGGTLLAAGIGLGGLLAAALLPPGSAGFDARLPRGAGVGASLAAAVLAGRAAARPDRDAGTRRAWRLFALAFLAAAAGDLLPPVGVGRAPAWADLTGLLFYPLLLGGLLTYRGPGRSGHEQVRRTLDLAMVVLAGWMLTWHLFLAPAVRAAQPPALAAIFIAARGAGDLALAAGALAVLFPGRPRRAGGLPVLAAGLLLYAAAGLLGSFGRLGPHPLPGPLAEVLHLGVRVILALGAWVESRHTGQQEEPPTTTGAAGHSPFSPLPYAAISLSYGLLVAVASRTLDASLHGLLYGAVAMTALVMVRQYVTARENAQLTADQALRQSERRFRSLVQNSSDVITIVNASGHIVYQSPSVRRVFGFHPTELVGTPFHQWLEREEAVEAENILRWVTSRPGSVQQVEWRLRHRDGSSRLTETILSNLLDDPDVQGVVLNSRDITERQALMHQVHRQAWYDPLTGLPNRTLFRNRVEQALLQHLLHHLPVTVLFVDLDGFKTINDSLGHAAGDDLLLAVAERMRQHLGPDRLLARLGGDEFAVLLPTAGLAPAEELAQQLLDALAAPFRLGEHQVPVWASMGVASHSSGPINVDELLRNADVALSAAKDRGRGHYAVFTPAMLAAVRERLELATGLRQGLERQELVLHYQPAVDLETGALLGVEALVRWRHPQRGLIPPDQFIPLAEEVGLIVPLGAWVLREASQQLARWQRDYPRQAPAAVSVNLSVRQLEESDLVEQVAGILQATALSPGHLILEITESKLMAATEACRTNLLRLRELGVRLAIDDFGTGYSSLSYLAWFPVDILKVDRSFVQNLGHSDKAASLLRGIVDLAQALGAQAVAEGVERPEQRDLLRSLGCRAGQGYHFGRPLAAGALEAAWRQGQPLPPVATV